MTAPSFVRVHPLLFLFLAVLIASLPMLTLGFPEAAHDFVYHLQWVREFPEQVWGGELYPRWLDGLNNGLGSPVFYYYPPLEGYLATLLWPLAPIDPTGEIRFVILMIGITYLCGLAAWWWLGLYTDDRSPRMIGTLLYVFGPYHFAVDLYMRSAVAESLAFIFFPLILGGLAMLVRGDHRGGLVACLALALLLVTHTVSAIMIVPFTILFVLLEAPRRKRFGYLLVLGAVGLIAGGLAAVYLLPAVMQMGWANMENMFGDYARFFLPGIAPMLDPESGQRTVTLVINVTFLLILAFGLVLWRGYRGRFWKVVFVSSLLLTTILTAPLWDLLEPLQRLQFPWRFLAISSCALPPMYVLADRSGSVRTKRSSRWLLIISAAVVFFTIGIIGVVYFLTGTREDRNERIVASREWQIDPMEYTPPCMTEPMERLVSEESEFVRPGPVHFALASTGRPERTDDMRLSGEKRDLRLELSPRNAPVSVAIHRYYYPTWRAEGNRGVVETECAGESGLLLLHIPPGTSSVNVTMVESTWERRGANISLGALLLLLFSVALYRFLPPRGQI